MVDVNQNLQYLTYSWCVSKNKTLYVQKRTGEKPTKVGLVLKASFSKKFSTSSAANTSFAVQKLEVQNAPAESQDMDSSFDNNTTVYVLREAEFSTFGDVRGWNANKELLALRTKKNKASGQYLKTFLNASSSSSSQSQRSFNSVESDNDSEEEGELSPIRTPADSVPMFEGLNRVPSVSATTTTTTTTRTSKTPSTTQSQLLSQGISIYHIMSNPSCLTHHV